MARIHLAAGLFLLVLWMGGCQQKALVDLPSPNFSGPLVMQPTPPVPGPAPTPHAAVPQPAPTRPSPRIAQAPVPADWIPKVAPRPWEWIVIHHSATVAGGAARFDREHRQKGWDELGYDFVIGNGTDTGDGQIEVGPRWPIQKWGAHARTPDNRYNERGIGICLVGNFDYDYPTPAQMQSLIRLTTWLVRTYHIRNENIIGHNDTKQTDCPGRNFSVANVRKRCAAALAQQGFPLPAPLHAASGELLHDAAKK